MNFLTLLVKLFPHLISPFQIKFRNFIEKLFISLHEIRFMAVTQPSFITHSRHQLFLLIGWVGRRRSDVSFWSYWLLLFLNSWSVCFLRVYANLSTNCSFLVRTNILVQIWLQTRSRFDYWGFWFNWIIQWVLVSTESWICLTFVSAAQLLNHIILPFFRKSFMPVSRLLWKIFSSLPL
jgi:hypothetical protein